MTEADLNTSIKNSLAWAYKIPDPAQAVVTVSAKRPFDGFGIFRPDALPVMPIYWESKLLKGFQALPFDRVSPHQVDALRDIKAIGGNGVLALVLVGVHIPYHGIQLFSFDIDCFLAIKEKASGKSITKAQFMFLESLKWYLTSSKERFNIESELYSKTLQVWNCPLLTSEG